MRLGWCWTDFGALALLYHGPLMTGGFLGALITVERAVALGYRWTYAAPIAAIAGSIALLGGLPQPVGASLILVASLILMLEFAIILYRQRAMFIVTMSLGALVWTVGNGLWLAGRLIPPAVPWWMGFLVLTIVGERLELSRFLPTSPGRRALFMVAISIYLSGLLLGVAWPGLGSVVAGLGLIALSLWLTVFDLARVTIRQSGLTRFVAVCLLSGYAWLAIAGIMAIGHIWGGAGDWIKDAPVAGFMYDGFLHAVFLGFVFAMIFGHAPIIFPAVLNVQMKYHWRFYSHLTLLHVSIAMRIAADLVGLPVVREWAGLVNAITIVVFMANTVTALRFHSSGRNESRAEVQAGT